MNTPTLSVDISPVSSFCSMADPFSPTANLVSLPLPSSLPPCTTSSFLPQVLSPELIQQAALDVIDILSVSFMHMGGAYNPHLVSESAWVAAMAVDCEQYMKIGYYYEIQKQVTFLLRLQMDHTRVIPPPPQAPTPRSTVLHNRHQLTCVPAAKVQHYNSSSKEQRIVCDDCLRSFSRSDSLDRHRQRSCTYQKATDKPSKSNHHIKHVFSIRPY